MENLLQYFWRILKNTLALSTTRSTFRISKRESFSIAYYKKESRDLAENLTSRKICDNPRDIFERFLSTFHSSRQHLSGLIAKRGGLWVSDCCKQSLIYRDLPSSNVRERFRWIFHRGHLKRKQLYNEATRRDFKGLFIGVI